MRSINRVNSPAHHIGIFLRDIFWPTLQSIYDLRQELSVSDTAELGILEKLLGDRTLTGIDEPLLQQRELATKREEKQAEIDRKWALIHAGCQFMAMLLNEGRDEWLPELTPEQVYRTVVEGERLEMDGLEALTLG